MSSENAQVWTPPARLEDTFKSQDGNKFAGLNRPDSGARDDVELPKGDAPFQLYSLATPNGQKVTILLEELGIEYDAHTINIMKGQQFSKGFVDINPNSKIPCGLDTKPSDGGAPLPVFESGSICLYLAQKYAKFWPKDVRKQQEALNWVFWQMGGQGPMTGQFGHFFVYAPDSQIGARDYGAARYGMEAARLCDVLDKALEGKEYLCGDEYTIADIMCFPWYYHLSPFKEGYKHKSGNAAKSFLGTEKYKNANRWAEKLLARPGVQRGLLVNSNWSGEGPTKLWMAKDSPHAHLRTDTEEAQVAKL